MDPGFFDKITNEILEKILLDIPTSQIEFNGSWVCKRWTEIIEQPRFWVKKLKLDGFIIEDKIWSQLSKKKGDMKDTAGCLYYAAQFREFKEKGLVGNKSHSDFFHGIPTPSKIYHDDPGVIDHGYFTNFRYTDVEIKDDKTVLMISGVLIYTKLWRIILRLQNEVIKGLPVLLKLIKARKIEVILRDNYAFWNFSPRLDYCKLLKGRERGFEPPCLRKFWGSLLTLRGLPIENRYLSLAIAVDPQNRAIDPGLAEISEDCGMDLHFKAGTDISNLEEISFGVGMNCFVSNMQESHIPWMVEVSKKLLKSVIALVFFNYQLDLKATKKLFESMAEAGFKLKDGEYDHYEFIFLSSVLPQDSIKVMEELARTLWPIKNPKRTKYPLNISIFKDEDECAHHICNKAGIDLPDKI